MGANRQATRSGPRSENRGGPKVFLLVSHAKILHGSIWACHQLNQMCISSACFIFHAFFYSMHLVVLFLPTWRPLEAQWTSRPSCVCIHSSWFTSPRPLHAKFGTSHLHEVIHSFLSCPTISSPMPNFQESRTLSLPSPLQVVCFFAFHQLLFIEPHSQQPYTLPSLSHQHPTMLVCQPHHLEHSSTSPAAPNDRSAPALLSAMVASYSIAPYVHKSSYKYLHKTPLLSASKEPVDSLPPDTSPPR